MWWLRKVRKADIPEADRDTFERFGEPVIGMLLAGGFSPPLPELAQIYADKAKQEHARDWLTERSDAHERREQRQETLEWAVLIFVVVGVLVDILPLLHDWVR
jgi:hypothetical protein